MQDHGGITAAERHQQSQFASKISEILRCPFCRKRLRQDQAAYACSDCGRSFPIVNGVAQFVPPSNYAENFGFEWQVHCRTQLDNESSRESESAFRDKTGFTPQELKGKLVLDVGCGMGRFADVATRWGAQVVGVDLSAAAAVAARNLRERSFVAFQADVFALPFAPESFDYIYSIGVLHHTPDCEQAFKSLPRLLKPGGRIAVWLYSAYNPWYRMSDVYRKVTRRMKPETLHPLCNVVIPLYGIHKVLKKVPIVGRKASGALAWALPISHDPDPEWRVLDTFDWYSPWYQSKHTYEEVFRWFESCGLEDLRVIGEPIAVQGMRPKFVRSDAAGQAAEVAQCVE